MREFCLSSVRRSNPSSAKNIGCRSRWIRKLFGVEKLEQRNLLTCGPTLWGVELGSGDIYQIDPDTGMAITSFPGPFDSATPEVGMSIAEGGSSLIYLDAGLNDDVLFRLDPANGTILSSESSELTGSELRGLSFESSTGDSIFRTTPEFTGERLQVFRQEGFGGATDLHLSEVSGFDPPFTALGGDDTGRQFGVQESTNTIFEYDPSSPESILNAFEGLGGENGPKIEGMAFDGNRLYVSEDTGKLTTLDPDTGEILNEFDSPAGPIVGLAAFAGEVMCGSIHGFKFEDFDNDGTYEPIDGETPFGGIQFELSQQEQVIAIETTDQSGQFWFTRLEPGEYNLREIVEALPNDVKPSTPFEVTLTVGAGEELVWTEGAAMLLPNAQRQEVVLGNELIFGNVIKGSIHGFKFEDFDADGNYEPEEGDVPWGGISFQLLDSDGSVVATETTASGIMPTTIASTTPVVTEIPAPPSVKLGTWVSDSDIFAFEEKSITLESSINVDYTLPGTYFASVVDATPGVIPAGTSVTSFLVHQDTVPDVVGLSGSITFSSEILGVIGSDSLLDVTDPILGFDGTSYGTGESHRGALDSVQPDDQLTISSDRRTLSFDVHRTGGATDQYRVITAASDLSGEFWFTGLLPGEYTIREVTESLPRAVMPSTQPEATVFVKSGQELVWREGAARLALDALQEEVLVGEPLMFGNYIKGSIHGFKFEDFNADGVYQPDDGDVPWSDISFELLDASGNSVQSVTSNADGEFWFVDLIPGEYTIRETADLTGDMMASTPTEVTVFVGSGQELVWTDGAAMLDEDAQQVEVNVGTDLIFGNYVKGSIHGFKFEDINADGVYQPDDGDFPMEGIPFELVDANGAKQTTTSNANGEFEFTDVVPGNYTVRETADLTGHMMASTPTEVELFVGSRQELVWQDGAADLEEYVLLQTLPNPSGESFDNFGWSVAAVGSNVLVGAPRANTDGVPVSGAVYLCDTSAPASCREIPNPNPTPERGGISDRFGESVAVVGNNALIGAKNVDTNGVLDSGAVYLFDASDPTNIDPMNIAEIPNPSPGSGDSFGEAIAVVGHNALIGAKNVDTNGVLDSGAVYLFDASDPTNIDPMNIVEIPNPSPERGDLFGSAVAAVGNNVLVGATGVDTDGVQLSGAVYLFEASDPTNIDPMNIVEIPNPSPEFGDQFGWSVAAVGNNVLAGAIGVDTDGVQHSGAVYLFDASDPTNIDSMNIVEIPNPSPEPFDSFGETIAVVGNNAIIGAPNVDTDGVLGSGTVYLFDASDPTDIDPMNIVEIPNPSPEPGEGFGWSVAAVGDNVLIGAPGVDNNGVGGSGVVYLYGPQLKREVNVGSQLMFGNYIKGSIHGFKFEDFDADGAYDPDLGDVPFEGVPFELVDAEGNSVGSTTTDAVGEFHFVGLVPGQYTVREMTEMLPDDVMASTASEVTLFVRSRDELVWRQGAAELDPDAPQEEIEVGDQLTFGNFIKGSIHGFKFEDLDADGVYEPEEGDVPWGGISFQLLDSDGNVVTTVTTANGITPTTIASTDGVTVVSTPPSSVQLGRFVSDTNIQAIKESTLSLESDLDVEITTPGIYSTTPVRPFPIPTPGVIPAGTPITSYLIHQDTSTTLGLTGSITFSAEILGVIYSDSALDATDALLGATTTVYGTTETHRGALDSIQPEDRLEFSTDRRTLTFHLNRTGGATDQYRVITAAYDLSGEFWFTGLKPGEYTVREVIDPAGDIVPSTPTEVTLFVGSGQELVWAEGAAMLDHDALQEEVIIGDELIFGNFRRADQPTLDWGDAPDLYPTLDADNGASHIIDPDVFLGTRIDAEADGQPTANANGDNTNGMNDEDGVQFVSPLVPGTVATLEVVSSTDAMLDAWMDFDQDGTWSPSEQIVASKPLVAGANIITYSVPDSAFPSPTQPTFSRFRLSTEGGLSPTGAAKDGEVEDYVYLNGDLNSDLVTDVEDISLLCKSINENTRAGDLNGDGATDRGDLDYLTHNVLGTFYGDANLDRRFNSGDLILMFQAGEYEDGIPNNSTWSDGDSNCDGEFTTADLIRQFQDGGYGVAAIARDVARRIFNGQQDPPNDDSSAPPTKPCDSKPDRRKHELEAQITDRLFADYFDFKMRRFGRTCDIEPTNESEKWNSFGKIQN